MRDSISADQWSAHFLSYFFDAKNTYPDRTAVVDQAGQRQTDYRTYVATVNAIGAELGAHGMQPGDVAAICLGRCMEHHAARIACLATGAVFVSLSPALPQARQDMIVEESGAKLIIDQQFVDQALQDHPDAPDCLNPQLTDTDPGYIVFTSGTTGKPKGMLHDRTLFQMLAYVHRDIYAPGMGVTDASAEEMPARIFDGTFYTHAALCDPTVVMSVFDTAVTLGVTVHIIEPGMLRDAAGLIGYFKKNAINTTIAVPGLLNALAPHVTLSCVVIAGDMNRFDFSKMDQTFVANVYGASECPIMAWGDARRGNQIRPLLPEGDIWVDEEGAVLFEGPGILTEYVNDAGRATDAVMVTESGKRILATGDAGIAHADGSVEVRGRMDNTVKLRGNRVALEEVEAALGCVPGVVDVAACLDPHNPDCLRALYTSATGRRIPDQAFVQVLEQKLPAYMMPVTFTQVTAFEKTLSNKVVRTCLPGLLEAALPASAAEPEDETAELDDGADTVTRVARAFARVLGLANVNPDDDFLRLGGDSLRAMELQQELARMFRVNLSANRLTQLATPRGIAEAVENPGLDELPYVDQLAYTFDDVCPLTESQWNIYLGSGTSATQSSTRYNLPFDLHLGEGFAPQDVQGILDYLVWRHPVLTARVVLEKNIPHMVYDRKPQVEVGTPEDAKGFVRSFDLTQGVVHALYVNEDDGAHFYLDIHHIVVDGTSLSLLGHDIATAAQRAGRAKQGDMSGLTRSRMNLLGSDDSVDEGMLRQLTFEKAIADTPAYASAKAFFAQMLADAADAPALLDSPHKGGHHRTIYEPFAQLEDVAAFACAHGVTLNQLLACAFAYTLAEFVDNDQAAFSVIEDGRSTLDLGKSVGMFTRTVPVLIDCSEQPVNQFLSAGASVVAKALSYDFYPLRLIVAATPANTDIQFQYSHGLHEYGGTSLGAMSYDYIKEQSMPACDLSFEVAGDGGVVRVIVEHSDRYSAELAASMEATFEAVLTQLMQVERLGEINPLPQQQAAWLDAANQTSYDFPQASVMDAVRETFQTCAARPFVVWEGGSYTYAQASHVLAAAHEAMGGCDAPGEHAAVVFTGRNHLFPLAAWSALTAGFTYVPVEPDHPDERISYVSSDVAAAVMLVDNSTAERAQQIIASLEDVQPVLVNMEAIEAELAAAGTLQNGESAALTYANWGHEDTMCVLYTSGTTGQPKGVELPHRAFVNVAQNYVDITGMTSQDVYSLYTPLSFDMHTLCLFCSTMTGACMNVVPSDIRLDLGELDNYFKRMGATHACMTTHVGKMFVAKGLGTSLNHLLVIGETLGEFTAPEKPVMWESYGPTESLALITQIPVNDRSHSSSVGPLYRNVQSYLLDRCGRRSPVGAQGELCIAGEQLALGYRNRPEQTSAAFIVCTNLEEGQELRLYKSGDVARYLPDGTLGFLGRNDDQVKIRGNRVELSEVEDAIAKLPWIKDVACIAVKHDAFKDLAAYVVVDAQSEEAGLDDAELFTAVTKAVKEQKPSYMVPAYVVRLDKLPVNANGKVARRLLPKPAATAQQEGYVAPETQAQKILCQVFELVLGAEQIGINDDFIRLGGDSVNAMRAAWELSERGLECKAFTILENRTPAAIAQALEDDGITVGAAREAANEEPEAQIPLGWHDEEGHFEGMLTPTLLNFYDNEVNIGMGSAYVFAGVCLCPAGTTQEQALAAIDAVIADHPAFQSKVEVRDGEPRLVDGGNPEILVKSLATESMDQIRAELSEPFDMAQNMSRFFAVNTGQGYAVAYAAHHLISDAMSVALTARYLMQAAAAAMEGRTPEVATDWAFIDVVNDRLRAAASSRYQHAQEYFARILDAEMIDRHALGLNRQLGAGDAGVLCVVAPGVRAEVERYAQEAGYTLGALGHAVFAHVLTRFSGQDVSLYKTGIHGRYTPEAEAGIGCMAEFTVVHNPRSADLAAVLGSALEDTTNVVERSLYPYKLLKSEYPHITYLPFFEYVPLNPSFNPPKETKLDSRHELWSGQLPAADGNVIADFTGMLHDCEDGLAFVIEHSSKYPRPELEGLCQDFFETLLTIVEGGPISADAHAQTETTPR